MNTKKYIKTELNEAGHDISISNLTRYISGDRKPSLSVAKELSRITGSCIVIWLDAKKREQRENTLRVYSKKIGGDIFFSAGRPKKHTNGTEV